jgi:hypothetical protein
MIISLEWNWCGGGSYRWRPGKNTSQSNSVFSTHLEKHLFQEACHSVLMSPSFKGNSPHHNVLTCFSPSPCETHKKGELFQLIGAALECMLRKHLLNENIMHDRIDEWMGEWVREYKVFSSTRWCPFKDQKKPRRG